MLAWFFASSLGFAQTRACPELFVAGLTAPIRRAEVLATNRFGPHLFDRDGRTHEVFVNPGIPPDGARSLSIVREYPSRRQARVCMQQLMYLLNDGWPVVALFGLTGREVILDLIEGPTLAAVLADPATRAPLHHAWTLMLENFGEWAKANRLHAQRRGDELRVRGSYKNRRLHFKLRPEHIVVDLIARRLVINDVDPD